MSDTLDKRRLDKLVALIAGLYDKQPRQGDLSLDRPLDCTGCQSCCRNGPNASGIDPAEDSAATIQWFEERGALGEELPESPFHGTTRRPIEHPCPALSNGGCSLHGTDLKPVACRDLDCRGMFAGIAMTQHRKLVKEFMRLDRPGGPQAAMAEAALNARRRALKQKGTDQ